MREVNRLLFVRTDRMGDVLMNLPAIRLLRRTFPKAWLALLADAPVAPLFQGHPDIDEVIVADMVRVKSGWKEKQKLIARVRKNGFDLMVVSNPDKFLHWMAFLSGAKHRIGYDRKWGFLLTRRLPLATGGERHEFEKNLELASLASDQAWDGTLAMASDDSVSREIDARLSAVGGQGFIAIHPGTSNSQKRWSPECFSMLCERLVTLRAERLILIGGAEEAETSRQVAAGVRSPIVDWTGCLTLQELAAFLAHPRVKLLISVDSGPVHVAWMSGTPVVAIYAKNSAGSDPHRWGPRDNTSEVIFKPIADVYVSEVTEKALAVLARGKADRS